MPAATADVVIVGGGVMGSSVAYHLRAAGFPGGVLVVERDLTYRQASSALSVGGIRQQFGAEINVHIARHTVAFYERFAELMAVGAERHRAWGAEVELLEGADVLKIVPDLNPDGIAGASFGPRDGYLDPYAVMRGFARKA